MRSLRNKNLYTEDRKQPKPVQTTMLHRIGKRGFRHGRNKNIEKRRVTFSRLKRRIFKHVRIIRSLLALLIFIVLAGIALLGFSFIDSSGAGREVSLAYDFIFTPVSKVKSVNGRTNVLILGKSSSGWDYAGATDTIIFMSFSNTKPGITLITLPGEIWIDDLNTTLDSVYNWGNQKEPNGGLVLAKSVVEEITGQPVQYAFVVDLSVFKKIVDELGGVEVNVEKGFTDDHFPIVGKGNDDCGGDPDLKCRYETVTFTQGSQTMDGNRALSYLMARNASNTKGTDFTRSKRMIELLVAIKNKIVGKKSILHPSTIFKVIETAGDYIKTDLIPDSEVILARRFFQTGNKKSSYALSDKFLENPPADPKYGNLYVVVPKDGNWDNVHSWVSCVLAGGYCTD